MCVRGPRRRQNGGKDGVMGRQHNRATAVLACDVLNCPVFTTLKLPSSIECHLDMYICA